MSRITRSGTLPSKPHTCFSRMQRSPEWIVALVAASFVPLHGEDSKLSPIPGESSMTAPLGVNFHLAGDTKGSKVKSPTAIAFDETGAVYVTETHRFGAGVEDDRNCLYWYIDDIKSQTNEDRRALHEKWKAKKPLEYMTKHSEIVRKLEDRNGDGVFEKSEVFADGFNDVLDGTAAGVFAMEGTVYFACVPKIWALRDTKGTGKADVRDVIQDGFGVRISLSGHDLNGFALGPDGRIYATMGDRGFTLTTREGKKHVYPDQGAILRFEPDGTQFEVVHTGLRNPKEIAFDEMGNAFSVDNNSDQGDKARVVYIVEGGDSGWTMAHQTMHTFHREIGLPDHPENRWMADKMWQPPTAGQPAYIVPAVANLTDGPSGLTYHPGTGYREAEAGRFLVCDYKGSAATSGIWSLKVEPEGAGMKMTDARHAVWGVAATDVEYSWDGRIFVSDFKGGWRSHNEGRVFYLDAGKETFRAHEVRQVANLIKEGFDQRSSEELGKLLGHADQRVRIRAQLALTRKADGLARFKKSTESARSLERLHGVWGLGILARRGEAAARPVAGASKRNESLRLTASRELLKLLAHADAEVRGQAVKALGEGALKADEIPFDRLLTDASPRVRLFAAITAGQLRATRSMPQILKLLEETADKDAYLRHGGVFALQHLATPDQLIALKSHASVDVRVAAVVALRRLRNPGTSAFIQDADARVSEEAIRAIHDEGIEAARSEVAALLDSPTTKRSTMMWKRLLNSAFRLGGPENAKRLLKVASDSAVPLASRREALRLIAVWPEPPEVDQALGRYAPLPKRSLEELKACLGEALPGLLKNEDALADALDLVFRFDLKIQGLDDASLRSIIRTPSLPGPARARALELYAVGKPAGLAAFLGELAGEESEPVALAALGLLVADFPSEALESLIAAATSSSAARSQYAWKQLGAMKSDAVDDLIVGQLERLKELGGVSPSALELLAAAKGQTNGAVAKALAGYEADQASKAANDPLAEWLPSLEGGDPLRGAAFFQSHPVAECLRCHRAEAGGDFGGEAGPNLAGIATRGDRRYLLESLVIPSAKVVPGYGIVSLTFKNGKSLGGYLVAETAEHMDIHANDKYWRVKRSDIATFTPAVSAMPPMGMLMKPEEIRDVVAWLETLTKGAKPAKTLPEPPLLDPEKLP
jgi:quinoprotein glucose dehydrogenase